MSVALMGVTVAIRVPIVPEGAVAWHVRCTEVRPGDNMLYYALIFFVIAIIAGFFGFFGIASDAAWIGKVLFVAFLIAAIVSLAMGRRRPIT